MYPSREKINSAAVLRQPLRYPDERSNPYDLTIDFYQKEYKKHEGECQDVSAMLYQVRLVGAVSRKHY